jgi:hypothetical protein
VGLCRLGGDDLARGRVPQPVAGCAPGPPSSR